MELLLSKFLSSSYIDSEFNYNALDEEELEQLGTSNGEVDPYQHFAAVLMNATQTKAGRRFVMRIQQQQEEKSNTTTTTTTSVLEVLLGQLKHSNPIRRRGIAGMIKNCCLEQEETCTDNNTSWWLLDQVKILKHLLYPLAGPEELDMDERRGMDVDLWMEGPDKVREPDYLTRLYLVESILVLCATGRRKSRERIRLGRTYVILKWADMVEEHEDVSERINECVQYLRRDEEGTIEGSSDQMVEDAYKNTTTTTTDAANTDDDDDKKHHRPQLKMALPTSSSAVQTSKDDYDDVD